MSTPSPAFDADQTRALLALLDTLIPPSAELGLPGAGEAGVLAYLAERAADLQPLLIQCLSALDARAAQQGADAFASLAAPERAALLSAHAEQDVLLLPALVFHTYCGYYQQQAVVEALGLPHRPPFPEGYALAPTDTSLLFAMRQRAPLYREV